MMRRILSWLTSKLDPPRVLASRDGLSPYLSRWYLTPSPRMSDGSWPWTPGGGPRDGIVWPMREFGIYLHQFHRGDDDTDLHNHPWRWAVSIILAGGYIEERRTADDHVDVRTVRPGRINIIRASDFHRVELLERDAWSFFIAGPKFSSWGFWNRTTKRFLPWRQFIEQRRKPREAVS